MNLTKPCFSAMASGSMDCTLLKRADPWVRFIANSLPATSEDPERGISIGDQTCENRLSV
jgi:hypothetical protein